MLEVITISMISAAVFIVLMVPFIKNLREEKLLDVWSLSDVSSLEKMREMILEKFIQEEKNFHGGFLNQKEWKKRAEFLINQYVDCSQRLDRNR